MKQDGFTPQCKSYMGTEIKPVIEDVVIDLSDVNWDMMTPQQYVLLEQKVQKSIRQRRKEIRKDKTSGKSVNVSIYGKLYQISDKDYKELKKDPEKMKPYIVAMYKPLTDV